MLKTVAFLAAMWLILERLVRDQPLANASPDPVWFGDDDILAERIEWAMPENLESRIQRDWLRSPYR